MNFQSLIYHIEKYGCNYDHLVENSYLVTNCINLQVCVIEKLSSYGTVALCHYFYELGIPAPDGMQDEFDRYINIREDTEGESLNTKAGQEASEKRYQQNRSRGVTR